MDVEPPTLVAKLALVARSEKHPITVRPPLRRFLVLLKGHLAQLGVTRLSHEHVGTEFFVVAMLELLSATLTEHLTERCELHGIPCTNLETEILVQAKKLQEVSPVSN